MNPRLEVKSFIQRHPKLLALAVATAVLGVGGLAARRMSAGSPAPPPPRKVVYYQDSMHPWVKSDQPGKCTVCGMSLTPIYEGEAGFGTSDSIVVLNPNSVTALNVQTEEVKRQVLSRTLRVAGTLEANEARQAILSAPGPGRVETLAIDTVGAEVRKGQPLVTFFSPEWAQTSRYLQRAAIFNPRSSSTNPPAVAVRSDPGSANSEPFTSELAAPLSGTVAKRSVSPGQYVGEGAELLAIVDLSVLWFRFDVYEQQLPWLEVGQPIDVEVPAVPGRVFPAVIALIEPVLDNVTRAVKVRAEISNPVVAMKGHPHRLLRLGMYAQGRVRAGLPDALTLPRSAVLFAGDGTFAYVANADGVYERRKVTLGRQGDESWEVLSGVDEGDQVVSSGNVLIDAQAQLRSSGGPQEAVAHEVTSSRLHPRDSVR